MADIVSTPLWTALEKKMATDAQKKEVTEKATKLVNDKFGGDYRRALTYYDADKVDGCINRAELVNLLKDAGVGNWLTRGMWADGIIEAMDADKDKTISPTEFEAVVKPAQPPLGQGA